MQRPIKKEARCESQQADIRFIKAAFDHFVFFVPDIFVVV